MKLLAIAALALTTLASPALADGDAEKGAKVFRKCKACHSAKVDGKNKVGPMLYGIVGAEAGRNADYKYSKVLIAKAEEGLVWTEENLNTWLENPQAFAKKAKMVLKLKKPTDRANVIAYLKSVGPQEADEPEEAEESEEASEPAEAAAQ